jgi:hypothetical protein
MGEDRDKQQSVEDGLAAMEDLEVPQQVSEEVAGGGAPSVSEIVVTKTTDKAS